MRRDVQDIVLHVVVSDVRDSGFGTSRRNIASTRAR